MLFCLTACGPEEEVKLPILVDGIPEHIVIRSQEGGIYEP